MTQADITHEKALELIGLHGNGIAAAKAIYTECRTPRGLPVRWPTVRDWISRARNGKITPEVYHRAHDDKLNRIAELLERANVPLEAIGQIESVKLKAYGIGIKNAEGKIETEGMFSTAITLSPKWADGPNWPVVQPAKPCRVIYRPHVALPRVVRTIVILPDVQVGFLRQLDSRMKGLDETFRLEPMHDVAALDVAYQILADIQPDQFGWIGDFLDLSEQSRWMQHESFWRTTQPAIDAGHAILATAESAAGPNRDQTFLIAGNHDRRISEYIQKNARAAFALRPAMATPTDWPDLTIPRLLRLDELGIEYCGEYPGSEKWLARDLVVRHDPQKKLDYDASIIVGHTHKIKRETYSRRTQLGPLRFTNYEIGCLCRLGRNSDRNSLMSTAVPSDRGFISGWAQGVAVIQIDNDGQHQLDMVEIVNGKALYRGRSYAAPKELREVA